MLHHVYGRKLNRTANERKRLFKNLSRSLILEGQIKTSFAKAKAIAPMVEKWVTRARVDSLNTRRLLLKEIFDNQVVEKLIKEIGPLFKSRNGGYTRIIKLGNRASDNTKMVLLAFTQEVTKTTVEKEVNKKKKTKELSPVKEEKPKKGEVKNAKQQNDKTK